MKGCHVKDSGNKTETQMSLFLETMDARTFALVQRTEEKHTRDRERDISDVGHTGRRNDCALRVWSLI